MVSEMQTSCVFTARNTGCGKAMFSQESVNLLTGEGISGTRSLLGRQVYPRVGIQGGEGIPRGVGMGGVGIYLPPLLISCGGHRNTYG